MREDLEKKLIEKYPKIFALADNKDSRMPFAFFGIECGDGWYDILDSLCSNIQHHADWKMESQEYKIKDGRIKEEDRVTYQPVVHQIKEKFGGLRFYIEGGDEYTDGAISMAESLSYKTCEECGKKGSTEGSEGWILCLCVDCRELDRKRKEEYKAESAKRLAEYYAKQEQEKNNG